MEMNKMTIEEKRAVLQRWEPDYEGFKTMSNKVVEYIHMKITEPGMSFLGLEIDLERTIKESRAKKDACPSEDGQAMNLSNFIVK